VAPPMPLLGRVSCHNAVATLFTNAVCVDESVYDSNTVCMVHCRGHVNCHNIQSLPCTPLPVTAVCGKMSVEEYTDTTPTTNTGKMHGKANALAGTMSTVPSLSSMCARIR
jgi:hypothetical protein